MKNRKFYMLVSRLSSIVIIAGLFLYFSIRMPDIWLTTYNMVNLVEQTVSIGLVALGFTIARAAGQTDLSVGSVVSLTSMMSMGLIMAGKPIWLSILTCIVVGVAVGLANGFMKTVLELPGLIPSIGTSNFVGGLAMVYGWGNMIFGRGQAVDRFCMLGRGYIGSVSIPAVILGIAALMIWFLLMRTRYGRLLYMVGGNPKASGMSGVQVRLCITLAFILSGAFSGLGGVIMTARIGAGNPLAGGDMLLQAIISTMLGSTILAEEQEFSPLGSLVGAFFMTILMTGMQMSAQGYHLQCLLQGALLFISLGLFSLQRLAAE